MLMQFYYFYASLRDIAVAIFDIVTFKKRRCYEYSFDILAPRELVWNVSTAPDITYEQFELRIVQEPIGDVENGYFFKPYLRGKARPVIAAQRLEWLEGRSYALKYMPEQCEDARTIGDDDIVTAHLDNAQTATRCTLSRELTHRRLGTRISAPMGLRASAWLVKTEAERQSGRAPAASKTALNQIAIAILSIASFWYLMGPADAAIVVVLVILHELGHAAAMRLVGVPVGFVSLIPFFGGVAAPKRPYESDWKFGFVALMGPGFSLLPTAGLLALAYLYDWQLAAHAAALFAVINGVNLAPVSPLDGGVIVKNLLNAISSKLSLVVAWAGTLAGFAFAAHLQSPLLAVVFVFSAMQLITQKSLDLDRQRRSLSGSEAAGLLTGFVVVALAYFWLSFNAIRFERSLSSDYALDAGTSESQAVERP